MKGGWDRCAVEPLDRSRHKDSHGGTEITEGGFGGLSRRVR